VLDSDFGYLTGADPDGAVAFGLPVNEPYEEPFESGAEVDHLRETWRSPELLRAAADGVAAWSAAYAPRASDAAGILSRLRPGEHQQDDATEEGDWLFAETAFRLVFERLGFPDLDHTAFV
jgi:hypothetical protein